jgi:RNA polymerase sigma-70 factor (ECF subfamily)
MSASDDTRLVESARAGDADAFGELFSRYERRIYNYAYGIVGNPDDAKDVAQDAFLRVFNALPGTDGPLNFSAYVYRTAHNVACDLIGTRKRFAAPDALDFERETGLSADPERAALLAEQQVQARKAAFALPDDQRAVLTLRELHDMSYQEIADVLGMPRNTVGVYLSRARLGFKEAFRMTAVDIDKLTEECANMLPLLSAYIDDELEGSERARVEEHVEECRFCALALEDMREASRSYRALIPLLPPPEIAEAVMGRVDELAKTRRRPRRRLRAGHAVAIGALAGLAAAALVAGFAGNIGTEPVPDEVARLGKGIVAVPATETVSIVPTVTAEEPEPEPEPEEPEPVVAPPEPAPDTEPPATPEQMAPDDEHWSSEATVTLVWSAVDDPSGVRYGLEIQDWDSGETYVQLATIEGLRENSWVHQVYTLRQRWRVWAVDGAGNASEPSPWRTMGRTLTMIPLPPIEPYEPPTIY